MVAWLFKTQPYFATWQIKFYREPDDEESSLRETLEISIKVTHVLRPWSLELSAELPLRLGDMGPLAAIDLVGNILAFIDFSVSLFKSAREIHDASHGTLDENASCETVVREMKSLASRFLTAADSEMTKDYLPLKHLSAECYKISAQLEALFEKIKPKDSNSKGQSFLSALRNKRFEKEREGLEVRLRDCRSQLELQLNFLSRLVTHTDFGQAHPRTMLMSAQKQDPGRTSDSGCCLREGRVKAGGNTQAGKTASQTGEILLCRFRCPISVEVSTWHGGRSIPNHRQGAYTKMSLIEGMDHRENMVVETYSNTFSWVVHADVNDDEAVSTASSPDETVSKPCDGPVQTPPWSIKDKKFQAREKLRVWLAAEDTSDVFHLSGKMGAGKSTLMKLITESPYTAERLNKWAGEC